MKRFVLLAFLLLGIAPAAPAEPVAPASPVTAATSATTATSVAPTESIRLSYDLYAHGMKLGHIEEVFTRERNRYTLTSTSTPLGLLAVFKPGLVVMRSSGRLDEHGLRPDAFSHTRENDPDENRAEMDWTNGKLSLSSGGQQQSLALPAGTQDRISAMYQFMFLALRDGATLDFPMTNGRKLDDYHYDIHAGVEVATPLGKLDTLHLDYPAKPGEHRFEIWLATQYRNLPCKVILTEADGDQIIQILSSIEIGP